MNTANEQEFKRKMILHFVIELICSPAFFFFKSLDLATEGQTYLSQHGFIISTFREQRGAFNGLLAESMITAFELWMEIASFL